MNKIILLIALTFGVATLNAQTDGMSYQAVILDKNPLEIPGQDIGGNYLAGTEVTLRFTIEDAAQNIEFQESQLTTTDAFGMVNVIIGQGMLSSESPGSFNEINWNGEAKFLIIDLAYGDFDLEELSRQNLLFAPYAYHRNIIATQTLDVDGATTLNNTLYVEDATELGSTLLVSGSTNLSSTLDVSGETTLGDDLTVVGNTQLNQTLTVSGETNLNSSFNVLNQSPSSLSGSLTVNGITQLTDALAVDGSTTLNGTLLANNTSTFNGTSCFNNQVTIKTSFQGNDDDYSVYPLRLEGSKHGMAIQLSPSLPSSEHNFITFFDGQGNAIGRIEGETASDVLSSPDYIFALARYAAAGFNAGVNLATASAGVNVCGGFGVVTCPPSWSDIVIATANAAFVVADALAYGIFRMQNLGVAYQSGSADYAEYLMRSNPNEIITAADIVGVIGGEISMDLTNASQLLVVSSSPAVLGNLPEPSKENLYEQVAFMGQVPVKVFGEVNIGDYVIPSGKNDGVGIGVSPNEITPEQYSQIVGISWSYSPASENIGRVNLSIGLNSNDVASLVADQQAEIDQLVAQFSELEKRLIALESGQFPESFSAEESQVLTDLIAYENDVKNGVYNTYSQPETLSREHMEEVFTLVEKLLIEQGVDLKQNYVLNKMFYDPEFKEQVIQETMQNYAYSVQNKF